MKSANPKTFRSMAAVAVSIATASAVTLTSAPAGADTVVDLPRVQVTEALTGGGQIVVSGDDRARISPSMGATPLHRNVWVSGTVRVEAGPSMTRGRLEAGYILGCQVSLGGKSSTKSTAKNGEAGDALVDVGATTSSEVTLGPGDVARYPIIQHTQKDENGDSEKVGYYTFDGHKASFTYTNKTFGLTGCAGYAQARLYVNVTAYEKGAKTKITAYGKPFSIG